jgi:DNA polymerase-4
MPLYRALELCRELIVAVPDFERYREASRTIFRIFGRDAQTMEGLSLDEAYVALATEKLEEAVAYAQEARRAVREETGLAVSVGVARQKLLAKIASDDAKPNGLRAVEPGTEAAYLRGLPAGRLWGVGPKTQARLAQAGITLIGQIAELNDETLFALFGRQGRDIREAARGNDDTPVRSEREARSVSSETTFEHDVYSLGALRAYLDELCEDTAQRLSAHGVRALTVGVKLKRADFQVFGRQTTLAQPTDSAAVLRAAAVRCLERCGLRGEGIRLLGVRVGSLVQGSVVQMSFLGDFPQGLA